VKIKFININFAAAYAPYTRWYWKQQAFK